MRGLRYLKLRGRQTEELGDLRLESLDSLGKHTRAAWDARSCLSSLSQPASQPARQPASQPDIQPDRQTWRLETLGHLTLEALET